jgi:uncharacterized protein (TIGR02246 family)
MLEPRIVSAGHVVFSPALRFDAGITCDKKWGNSMRRLHILIAMFAICAAVFSGRACAAPADDAVSDIAAKWSAGFNKLDADAIASLYSKNALFYGSTPPLFRGKEGVTAYFNALPRWKSPTVQFSDLVTTPVGSDIINVAGTASFVIAENAPPVAFRLTWVIVREDGDWKILSHHVSPKAAPK